MSKIEDIVKRLLTPLSDGITTRIDGELDIGPRKYTFKAYCLQSRAKGHPVDLIRIDVKGE